MAESVLSASNEVRVKARGVLEGVHAYERVVLAFFCYLAALGLFRPIASIHKAALFAVPVSLSALMRLETTASRAWSRVVRPWASLALILVAYWLLAWFASAPLGRVESTWVAWDETLLNGTGLSGLGLKRAVEAAGWLGPSLIETCYLLVYAIPPISLGILYACGAGAQANRYLTVLFLGTFTVYALLALFPIVSPRLAFPGRAAPAFQGIAHRLNIFLLDRFDISIGVFPSGHVAVAVSSALGLFGAVRERPWIWGGALLMAFFVYVDTIYGRYHYAVDGLASICVALLAWGVARTYFAKRDESGMASDA